MLEYGSKKAIKFENNVEKSDVVEEEQSEIDELQGEEEELANEVTDIQETTVERSALESNAAQIAQIGETTYETLESAIQAAKSR